MSAQMIKRGLLGAMCGALLAVGAAAPAQAAFDDPLDLVRPKPLADPSFKPSPPPFSTLEGPCGLAVDNGGNIWVSDYYHDAIDLFNGTNITSDPFVPTSGFPGPGIFSLRYGYELQVLDADPVDSACGLAFDASGNFYANVFHRSIAKFSFGAWSVITGATVNDEHPTGVAFDQGSERLYVNNGDGIAAFDPNTGTELGQVGAGDLEEGYGLAVSRAPGSTAGYVYAADAADDTVKVYGPTLGVTAPVAEIDGSGTPAGHFVNLKDASLAVDNASGELYVVDHMQELTSTPEAIVYVFDADGVYEGRLKYSVVWGQPNGIAVDNSGGPRQSRVYLTGGNTEGAAIWIYPPGAATSEAVPLPEPRELFIEDEEGSPVSFADPGVAETASIGVSAAAVASTPNKSAGATKKAKRKKARKVRKQRRGQAQHQPGSKASGR